jgi:DNA-binding transcriptional ArsR family regulator
MIREDAKLRLKRAGGDGGDMGSWVVSADLLARSRFVISPFSETVAALTVLSRPDLPGTPWIRSFRALHREAYLGMLAEDELRAVVADHAWRPRRGQVPGWIADFLALPPPGDGATFADELGQLAAWDDGRIRAEIRQFAAGPLPAALGRPGLRDAVADILHWVWTATLVSDWPRRRRVLEADIVTRTSRLASHGWAGVFDTLSSRTSWTSWLGQGRLQINGYELPDRDLSQARELDFVPVHSYTGWDMRELPHRYALAYPVSGALADTGSVHAGANSLARLIGPNRARVLRLLEEPRSTTQLAALTGLPLGAAGNHLRVLLEAGAVLRRRAGREVLYWRTSLGDALAASGR